MNVCSKCGYEFDSANVCPKCGANVVRINDDYLRRKKEWEENQKVSITIATAQGKKEINLNKKEEKEIEEETKETLFLDRLAAFIKKIRENAARKKRHKNDEQLVEMEEGEEENDYEKLLLAHIKFKSKRKKVFIILSVVLLTLAIGLGSAGIYMSIDRSDVAYYDGHVFYSIKDGEYFDPSEYEGYELVAFDEKMNCFFLKNSAIAEGNETGFSCVTKGKLYNLSVTGELTNQYMFSDSGTVLAFVTYYQTGDGAGIEMPGEYKLVLFDFESLKETVYESDKQMEIFRVFDDGRVIYTENETTGYSVVVSSDVSVCDFNSKWLIGEDIRNLIYDKDSDRVAYICDGRLFVCAVDSKFLGNCKTFVPDNAITIVSEDIVSCTNSENGSNIYYFDEKGLYLFENNESILLFTGASPSDRIYETGDSLFIKRMSQFYQLSEGRLLPVSETVKQVVIIGDELLLLESGGKLFRTENGNVIRCLENVKTCGNVAGNTGFCVVMEDDLYWIKNEKKCTPTMISGANIDENTKADIIYSKKAFYYMDSSNVLWKLNIKNGATDSLGYAKNAVYRKKIR